MTHGTVTAGSHGRPAVTVPCADCGLRTQIRSNCWIRGLTANGFFLFRGRDVAIAMNSVKILHAVRSAITAIAELLVWYFSRLTFRAHSGIDSLSYQLVTGCQPFHAGTNFPTSDNYNPDLREWRSMNLSLLSASVIIAVTHAQETCTRNLCQKLAPNRTQLCSMQFFCTRNI